MVGSGHRRRQIHDACGDVGAADHHEPHQAVYEVAPASLLNRYRMATVDSATAGGANETAYGAGTYPYAEATTFLGMRSVRS